ncbi:hypothetical protein Pcinc_013138 [Petrolisthes cinctipes]|uniref:Uncharacterized protein n=1 Tax=Petrolisthes cinctipes TaxID=88211 RepID=A0AAE1FZS1_PETCI|nr:hypothetical protein Pcinc_013138 [Petrolisthes cinctipes]
MSRSPHIDFPRGCSPFFPRREPVYSLIHFLSSATPQPPPYLSIIFLYTSSARPHLSPLPTYPSYSYTPPQLGHTSAPSLPIHHSPIYLLSSATPQPPPYLPIIVLYTSSARPHLSPLPTYPS